MMRTRKVDDVACDSFPGFGCVLTGKSLDSKGRLEKKAREIKEKSKKYAWLKL